MSQISRRSPVSENNKHVPSYKYNFYNLIHLMVLLNGLSRGILLNIIQKIFSMAIEATPWKSFYLLKDQCTIYISRSEYLNNICLSKRPVTFQVRSCFSLHTWKTKIICYIPFYRKIYLLITLSICASVPLKYECKNLLIPSLYVKIIILKVN